MSVNADMLYGQLHAETDVLGHETKNVSILSFICVLQLSEIRAVYKQKIICYF